MKHRPSPEPWIKEQQAPGQSFLAEYHPIHPERQFARTPLN